MNGITVPCAPGQTIAFSHQALTTEKVHDQHS
jgi:hypothetical protein